MPYSFIDIEREKNQFIGFLFIFLIAIYFLAALLLYFIIKNIFILFRLFSLDIVSIYRGSAPLKFPVFFGAGELFVILIVAAILGLVHWLFSTRNLMDKILKSLNAEELNPKDTYHQMLKNIVEEVSIATGGQRISCRVITTVAMNAFALQDFEGRGVIGVTEGLLAKLNRRQIEAVIGHEAAHIISGDSLMVTVSCALFGVYSEILKRIERVISISTRLDSLDIRLMVVLVLSYAVLSITKGAAFLLRMLISRQREYRSDAVSVRLTRDPISMAEALSRISQSWRGGGFAGDELSEIFIVNPNLSQLDETEGFLQDLFSTHPPIKNRIGIMLNMAHSDESVIKTTAKKSVKIASTPPVTQARELRWAVFKDGVWLGPFLLEELSNLDWLKPDSWIRNDSDNLVKPAYEDQYINRIFKKSQEDLSVSDVCPHCKQPLLEAIYEGTSILKCNYCGGTLVKVNDVLRILIRDDAGFTPEVISRGNGIIELQKKCGFPKAAKFDVQSLLNCPHCGMILKRSFYNLAYPVEIDKCFSCDLIWFDKDELDLLQYLIEYNIEREQP